MLANGQRGSLTETRLEDDASYSTTLITYTYDSLNRLIVENYDSSLTGLDYLTEYHYDIVGNRLEKTTLFENSEYEKISYQFNDLDQLFSNTKELFSAIDQLTLLETETTSQPRSTVGYVGELIDVGLGMINSRARYYNPVTGLFTQRDTFQGNFRYPQSLHKYAYTHNNPINAIDPTGLYSLGSALTANFEFMITYLYFKAYYAFLWP